MLTPQRRFRGTIGDTQLPPSMVRVPTSHLKPTWNEKLTWKWEKIYWIAYQFWTHWCWFVTLQNFLILFVSIIIHLTVSAGAEMILTNYGIVRLERDLDHIQMIQGKIEAIENYHNEWHNAYSKQLIKINSQLNQSIYMVRLEIQEELDQLREFISNNANATIQLSQTATVLNEVDMEAVELRFGEKIAEVELRLNTISQQISNISSTDSLNVIRSLSRRKYTVNLASKAHGASVLPNLSSTSLVPKTIWSSIFGFLFEPQTYDYAITDRSTIHPSEAWCFAGSKGQLMIQLWANASIEAVLYEHNYWYEVVPLSAPKDYDVVACYDSQCSNSSVISTCIYPAEKYEGPAQYCEVQIYSHVVDKVQIRFRSNHGQKYTCIYQLKVFGRQ